MKTKKFNANFMKKVFFIFTAIFCFISGYAQEPASKWRFNFAEGMGYDIEKTSDNEMRLINLGFNSQKAKKYGNDLKWGFQGNADIHYFLDKNFGIGLKYAYCQLSGKLDDQFTQSIDGENEKISQSFAFDKDYINYIGPSLHLRSFLGNPKITISFTASGGYTHVKSDSEFIRIIINNYYRDPDPGYVVFRQEEDEGMWLYESLPIHMTANAFGLDTGIGLEYSINKQIAIGIDAGYFYSSLNKVKIKGINKGINLKDLTVKGRNLSRLDFSLGIKIYL
jgi:opacity protein-like surface antigen